MLVFRINIFLVAQIFYWNIPRQVLFKLCCTFSFNWSLWVNIWIKFILLKSFIINIWGIISAWHVIWKVTDRLLSSLSTSCCSSEQSIWDIFTFDLLLNISSHENWIFNSIIKLRLRFIYVYSQINCLVVLIVRPFSFDDLSCIFNTQNWSISNTLAIKCSKLTFVQNTTVILRFFELF